MQATGALNVNQLAAMSLRLQPTRQARCYQGLDLAFSGEPQAALSLFTELGKYEGDRENQAIAWTNVAMVNADLGRIEGEFAAAARACELDPRILMAQVNRLITGIEIGREQAARQAAADLDALIGPSHPAVEALTLHSWRLRAMAPELQLAI